MFATRFFPSAFFAPRYFPIGGDFPPIPVSISIGVDSSVVYKPQTRTLHVRAWLRNEHYTTLDVLLKPERCQCYVIDEAGRVLFRAIGQQDPAGLGEYVFFEFVGVQLAVQHDYVMEITLESLNDPPGIQTWRQFPLPTVN